MSRSYLRDRIMTPLGFPVFSLLLIGGLTFSLSRILLAVEEKWPVLIGLAASAVILLGAAVVATATERVRRVQMIAAGFMAVVVVASGIVAGAVVGEAPLEKGEHAEKKPAAEKSEEPKPAGGEIDVADNVFEPAEITVAAGTTVVWTQSGSAPHTVTADDASLDSHPDCPADATKCMAAGDTFEFTFEEPGTYAYYCKLHGAPGGIGMAGVVTVEG